MNSSEIILCTTPQGHIKVEMIFQDEPVWLTQKAMAELFGVKRPAVIKHLLNVFDSGELNESSVSSILEHTALDGIGYTQQLFVLG